MTNRFLRCAVFGLLLLFGTVSAHAQEYSVKVKLQDSKTGEPIGYAAVSITKDGQKTVFKYAQTDGNGAATVSGIPAGKYKIEGILMGYDNYTEVITVSNNVDLGVKKMNMQANFLEGATVTDVGNPIVVKKDTIEHNVALMKSADNDVLEDLLKRLPGVEVDSDGKITANGKEINKIYVDGKEFFLNDPSLASKNLPAKIIEKVRVVEKKSEQAEFTGIDDGEEETVLDLGVKKGMMNGWFGNVMGGGGYDLQGKEAVNDARYQGAAMVARFTNSDQLAFIGNINNTNNRGFQDLAASSMGNMRMGGMRGGNYGIAKTYMAGLNGGHTFDNKSEVMGNALFNGNNRVVEENTATTRFMDDNKTSLYNIDNSINNNWTYGVRAGARADWKISKTTSLLFDPNFNIGWGGFDERNDFSSDRTVTATGVRSKVNDGYSTSTGKSNSQNASGRLLWRQRLGKPGRTISVNARYQFSNNDLTGYNNSLKNVYDDFHQIDPAYKDTVDQMYLRNSRSQTVSGRIYYTEPLGNNFFVSANYMYSYKKTDSYKDTYNKGKSGNYDVRDEIYSNLTDNKFTNQNVGIDFRKQEEKYNISVGASYQPSKTVNYTENGLFKRDTVLKTRNWSPNARVDINFSEYKMLRLNYRGSTSQPSINQMMPVPDNSDPQYVKLGNLSLRPSFSHNVWMMYRSTDMTNYASLNVNANFRYSTNSIVNATWYDEAGVQYSVPLNNDRGTKSASASVMFNTPIGKSKFSFMTFCRASYDAGVSFIGKSGAIIEDESSYLDPENYTRNNFQNVSAMLNARFTFRTDMLEASLGGRARYSQAWYSVTNDKTPTWTNNVNGEVIFNSDILSFKTDARYTFYIGYEDGYNTPQFVWNAEISKQLFKKQFTLALKAYDILNQSKNTYRSTSDNFVKDVRNNTLGRYIVLSLTYRFGNFGGNRGGMGPMGGPMGGRMGGGRRR